MDLTDDIEKTQIHSASATELASGEKSSVRSPFWLKVKHDLFEVRGIQPVPEDERNDTRYINVFTLWLSMSLSVLPLPFGILGTATYGLSLRDASLVIIFFSLLTAIPVSYFSTLGPKLGLRQMIISRYSWGRYLVSVPVVLNLATLIGFCIITDVLGGGILSAASDDSSMSWNVGIVIVGLLSLVISVFGYRVLHYYERFAWIAALICLIITAGIGGKHMSIQTDVPPASAQAVLSFGGLIAGYFVPWAALGSDFTVYMRPNAPPVRIFMYTYAGLLLPSIPIFILGAAIGGAAPNNSTWAAAQETGSIGLILAAILDPVGRFGKFLLVVLAFSIIANLAGTMYAIALNFQASVPWLARIPRFYFNIVTTILMIPLSVEAAKKFFVNVENFVGVIGFWSSSWTATVLCEHLLFRQSRPENYPQASWNVASKLPLGLAALLSSALSFALIIPGMSQVWFEGPIGKKTGDIGFELAFVVSFVLYAPFRYMERRFGR
ncbi:hypothetical protein EJ05DRAFT_492481 [Pseudovirgaria hyperparasitica]|uniref:Purine-cytosine permease FCY21 n=1 Tax=Pseudovirgaria hyperparasitica TaxID=470096 RepID=A0A6A6WEP6_9PEZI|nr:uncharacterized protein EJ05DRAFT_492481 [Pseudovirgaria hyperparasitica]KAF2760057.1 hypothetical protein EJ05DRAFT_492481 [Pseudovirgaria hyperparasitica]